VSVPDLLTRVRSLWDAYHREGVSGLARYADDDTEWTLSEGTTVRGLDALAEHLHSGAAPRSAVAQAWEEHGGAVLVHGSLRTFRDGGFVDVQPSWVYFFRDDRLVRVVAYSSRDAAMAAIAEHAERT
jgi:ketosteroid isomerase-like protein